MNNKLKPILKYTLVVFIGMMLGSAMTATPPTPKERVVTKEVVKEVPKVETKTVYKDRIVTKKVTPAACKEALNIDNKIFVKVGTALETFEFEEANAYMEEVLSERTSKYTVCMTS